MTKAASQKGGKAKSILIVGGGGMIGQKIARQLDREGLGDGTEANVILLDIAFPEDGAPCENEVLGSAADEILLGQLISARPDIVVDLASVVSGEAETDFMKGWCFNLTSTWMLLDLIRKENQKTQGDYCPRFVFTSSVAVFGAPFPEVIDDTFHCTPHSSYGSQKVACEMMVNDFCRKGFIDGLSLRLSTISVRPGPANKAATSFFSGIVREPLNGKEAILPVPTSTLHAHASPSSAARFVIHAASMETSLIDGHRSINMPCVSCTVGEQIEALRDIAGPDVANLVRYKHDDLVAGLVKSWPEKFRTTRAEALGFEAETDFHSIIQMYIEEAFQLAS